MERAVATGPGSQPTSNRCGLRGALLLLTSCLLLPQALAAQAPPAEASEFTPPADETEDEARYRQLIDGAVAEYQLGNFAEARALFSQAHAHKPNARTLRGMGMASFELRDYVQSTRELRQALASQASPLQGRLRSGVERLLQRAQAYVGTIELSVSPAHAQVTVDSRPVPPADWPHLALNLGEHLVEATAPTYRRARRSIRIQGGESLHLNLELRPRRGSPPASAVAQPQRKPPSSTAAPHPPPKPLAPATTALALNPGGSNQAPHQTDGSVLENPWLWAGIGAGVVAIIVVTALAAGGGDEEPDTYGGSSGTSLVAF